MSTEAPPWWAQLYDLDLADVMLEREEVGPTLHFLTSVLHLRAGDRVFDQCCGVGSLSRPLAEMGYEVEGWDLIPAYIERARSRPSRAAFVVADAFEHRAEPCAAGFNWWTSYGYAPTRADNRRMLERAFTSLRSGGRFALDFMNVPGVLRGFRPEVVVERGGVRIVRRSRLDLEQGRLHKLWRFEGPEDQVREQASEVLLLHPWELREDFLRVGFTEIRLFGDEDASELESDSPRCIVVGVKP